MSTESDKERFEFETYMAAIRYYQYGNTIQASTYPGKLVKFLFFDPTKIELCKRIARQFVYSDHDLNGEGDWVGRTDCHIHPWIMFYFFCKCFLDGFDDFAIDGVCGQWVPAFKVENEGCWYILQSYFENPEFTNTINMNKVHCLKPNHGKIEDYFECRKPFPSNYFKDRYRGEP